MIFTCFTSNLSLSLTGTDHNQNQIFSTLLPSLFHISFSTVRYISVHTADHLTFLSLSPTVNGSTCFLWLVRDTHSMNYSSCSMNWIIVCKKRHGHDKLSNSSSETVWCHYDYQRDVKRFCNSQGWEKKWFGPLSVHSTFHDLRGRHDCVFPFPVWYGADVDWGRSFVSFCSIWFNCHAHHPGQDVKKLRRRQSDVII